MTRIWPPGPPDPSPAPPEDAPLRDKVIHALRTVYDPEIPINIYDLGLIYDLRVDEATGFVHVTMTLTTPNCPEAESLPGAVRRAVEMIREVTEAEVDLVWQPPWDKSMMSEDARIALGLD